MTPKELKLQLALGSLTIKMKEHPLEEDEL